MTGDMTGDRGVDCRVGSSADADALCEAVAVSVGANMARRARAAAEPRNDMWLSFIAVAL